MKQGAHDQVLLLDWVFRGGHVKSFGTAIDGGAHHGTWALRLSERFKFVHAFEPDPENYAALMRACVSNGRVIVRRMALIDKPCTVRVVAPKHKELKTRSRQVVVSEAGDVKATNIDSMGLTDCGLIKLDLEGCEFPAVQGARKTIERCRPVLIVELDKHGERFGHSDDDLVRLVQGLGYRLIHRSHPDAVFVPV